ncbi:MAG: tetratricopeptide repeat protein [Patescibacteria group bacterium]
MFNIIPLSIIIVAVLAILFIVFKKFPQLSNLDLENLPEEKILQKKREIINKRIEKTGTVLQKKLTRYLSPLRKGWGLFQLKFRIYVGKIQRLLHHEEALKIKLKNKSMSKDEKEFKLAQLIQEAEQQFQLGNFDKAEDGFIAAVKVSPKSASAYRGLGDTYLAKNAIEEARQTYSFLLKLDPEDDSVLVKLAELSESQGDLEEAIQYYQRAILINDSFSTRFYHLAELLLKVEQPEVAKESILQAAELESQNPKYLDLLIEIAIICGDKALALETLNDLRLVNSDNQKLDSFKDRIQRIPDQLATSR